MVGTTGGILRFFHRLNRQVVEHVLHVPSLLQVLTDVITFAVHRRVNLVRHLAVALVLLEADVVGSCPNPHRFVIPGERRLPYPTMVPASYDGVGLRLLIAKVLRSIEEI